MMFVVQTRDVALALLVFAPQARDFACLLGFAFSEVLLALSFRQQDNAATNVVGFPCGGFDTL
jgi:hypothetical protein